ncbi:MAG: RNA ligase (ATP), partial [Candidatus Thorarchaeota archaeon]
MERRLVTVRKIKEIEEHPNADRLEIAVIDGWRCIVKKGEFKRGDSGLFFEIDSFLPIRDEFEFLRSGSTFKRMTVDGKEITGFRLRTMKLRGVLSQGLLVPLSMFPEIDFSEDKDYSDDLGVLKFEPPIPAQLSGQVEGMFPSYIKKTDQERIQNLPEYFEKYKDVEFEISEKLDGSSMTVFWDGEKFGVCSRNLELKEDEENTFWKVANKLDLRNKMTNGRKIAIQGELVGESIQKNPLKIQGQDFYVFDIWDTEEHRYLTSEERFKITSELGLKNVPIIGLEKIFH